MPRRRSLKAGRMVSILIEEELYEKAVQLARARGTSFSGLVRMLLRREVASSERSSGQPGMPVEVDPLAVSAWERSEQRLDLLEKRAVKLEEKVKQLARSGFREKGALKAEAYEVVQLARSALEELKDAEDQIRQAEALGAEGLAEPQLARAKDLRVRLENLIAMVMSK
jgi:antitoxin component of RelBE/YafQ-DinJ toxin-antitoxin module